MTEKDEVIREVEREIRALREELTLVYSEIVRLKAKIAELERNTPTPKQLGRVLEALRILERMEMEGGL